MFRLSTAFLFTVAAAGLLACNDGGQTGPEEPVAPAAEGGPLAATVTPEQSVTDSSSAVSLSLTTTRLPKSFFVHPVLGKDTNPGTAAKPFKTLARALGSTIAKDTVRLAAGVYSSATNGERFTKGTQQVTVPANVMILGHLVVGYSSELRGTGFETGLNLKGGATVRNLIVRGFYVGVRATQGVQSLKKLTLDKNIVGLELTGSANATLVSSTVFLKPPYGGFATGSHISQQAQFTMDGGIMTYGGPNCALGTTGLELHDASRATLKNAAALTYISGSALDMRGTSKATLTGYSTIDRNLPTGCMPGPSVITFNSAALTLQAARVLSSQGVNADGIASYSDAPLTLTTAILSGHTGSALRCVGKQKVTVSGSTIDRNQFGIDAGTVPAGSITINSSIVSDNVIGITSPFFKLRNSQVMSNKTGILVTSPFTDLGQTYDPGNNQISANSETGVRFAVSVMTGGVGGIFASGNTWNFSTQGSDASGHYPGKPLLNQSSPFASGKNFVLPKLDANDFFQIQL